MLSQRSALALSRLRAYTPPSPTQWHAFPVSRRAAVLILLFPDREGELKVVLTVRAKTLRNYAGQVALPGGKADTPQETPFTTARREALEEIGLPATPTFAGYAIEHLCELPASMAKTEIAVRPCVALLAPVGMDTTTTATLTSSISETEGKEGKGEVKVSDVEEKMLPRLDPKEVAEVFTVPFHDFLDAGAGTRAPDDGKGKGKEIEAETKARMADDKEEEKEKDKQTLYTGSWLPFHDRKWRMHNFYVPRLPSPSPVSSKLPPPSPSSSSPLNTTTTTTIVTTSSPSSPNKEGETPTLPDPTLYHRVWGMTARILVDAARVAYGADPEVFEFNTHFGDEEVLGRYLERNQGKLEKEKL